VHNQTEGHSEVVERVPVHKPTGQHHAGVEGVPVHNQTDERHVEIMQLISECFAVPVDTLTSRRRTRGVAFPRMVAMYLCRRVTLASFPVVGRLFGRHHSTVVRDVRRAKAILDEDPALRRLLEELLP
jgi:chromosomal replication initiator protein